MSDTLASKVKVISLQYFSTFYFILCLIAIDLEYIRQYLHQI